jgi:UDP-N-acetylmuramate--alanine ligase
VQVAIKALNTFEGVKRRFEKVGDIDGVPLVFDFAHHPTEIKSVLRRASAYGKILAVFQPHTYSRTKAYLDDFAQVFADAKSISALILLPTYAAREPQNHEFDSDAIMARILSKNAKQKVYVAENAMSSVEFAKIMAKDVGIVLFVGAGDIYDLKGCFC